MNIQATKLELMQLILESKNKELLGSLLRMIRTSSPTSGAGSYVQLTAEEKQAALEGLEDFENGRTVDFETVLKEFK